MQNALITPFQKLLGVSQENRLIKLDTALGPEVLLPQRVIAHEKLGRTYQYTVVVK